MSKLHLSTALSIASMGMIPMVSCTTTVSDASFYKKNETVAVTFNNLTGNTGSGHTVEGEATADTSKDYRCRFVSNRYEITTGVFVPTHKQLKEKDLEVICNNTNITWWCTLKNNVLTIPSHQLQGDITINLMGAEIADWITWDTINEISENDLKSDDHIAKQYFQVGDYKMIREGSKDVTYATIIGFEQQHFAYMEGAEIKYKISPFSFEMLEPRDKQMWGVGDLGPTLYKIPKWEDTGCTLSNFGTQKALSGDYGFVPRPVNLNTGNTNFSYFYVLSLNDQTGTAAASPLPELKGELDIHEDTSYRATLSYYRLNEYKSFELDSVWKRIARSQSRWIRDTTYYPDSYQRRKEEVVIKIQTDAPNKYCWSNRSEQYDNYVCWAFCM